MSLLPLFLLFSTFLVYSASCQCHKPDDNYINNICFSISDQPLNYQSAQSYCHGLSLNLAVISTTAQANFLASSVRTKTGTNDGLFWIGLSRPSLGSRFVWDDGSSMSWSNFDGSFPKDDLYVAESVVNGKWRTMSGEQIFYFVCSYDPRYVTPGTAQPSTAQPTGYDTSSTSYTTVDITSTTSNPYVTSTPGYTDSTASSTTDSITQSSTQAYSTSTSTQSTTDQPTSTTSYYISSSSSSQASTDYSSSSSAESSSTTSSG